MEKVGQFSAVISRKNDQKRRFLGGLIWGAHDVIMTPHCRFSTLDSSGLHILLEEIYLK